MAWSLFAQMKLRGCLQRGSFIKEEIFAVLEEAEGDKASGPDGFTMGSFQKCWIVLEEDVMAFVVDFHGSCIFEKSLNATFFLVSDS